MKQGFLQALGVTVYCILIGTFMWNGNHIFGQINNFLGPVLVLILFATSALICGLLVFYKPYRLFFEGKKKEAVSIVVHTTVWLFVFLAIAFLLVAIFR